MPIITLPDGSQRSFDKPVSVMDIAADIGPGLAKATLAGVVDEKLRDARFVIESDAELRIVTAKDEEGLEIIRHSTAHLLAQAVKRLYPEAQVTIGPVIENGFYYDFSYPPGFREEDLDRIAAEMRRIAKDALTVSREVMTRGEAIQFFRQQGEIYKAEIIESIPEGEEIGLSAGLSPLARICERRLGRPLSEAERGRLLARLAEVGPERLGDVALDLPPEALATWLAGGH